MALFGLSRLARRTKSLHLQTFQSKYQGYLRAVALYLRLHRHYHKYIPFLHTQVAQLFPRHSINI